MTPPPPASPPPAPPPATPPALDSLRAADAARLTAGDIDAAAARLGVDGNALRAVIKVESAGPGFDNGRPLLSFEPFVFSQSTGGRYDASHPGVSSASNRAYLGGTQAARWTKLAEAYALDSAAALGAASWGAFQLPGRYFAQAGYPNVFALVQDLSHSEVRQLAAFEAYLRTNGLIDELQRRDWGAFARAYEGEFGAGQYASALERAYASIVPASSDGYLESLVAENRNALTLADFQTVATQLGCEVEAVQAVVQVESGSLGAFSSTTGKLIILYEPHIFSRRTNHQYDASHPNISYRSWDATKYPRTQDGRWDQLRQAYALDPQNAVASASYGLFQIMGFNFAACGFADPKAFVSDMAKSQARQLVAFANFVRTNNLADELVRKDWEGFAGGYNGSGQIERYGRLLREAYERLKAQS